VAAVEVVDRTEREGLAALGDQPLAQLCQGDVRRRVDRPHQKLRLRLDPTRAPVAPARLRRRPAGAQILSIQRTALAMLTPNRRAAAFRDIPASTAPITRMRRSAERY
jgi:hypothetical protein